MKRLAAAAIGAVAWLPALPAAQVLAQAETLMVASPRPAVQQPLLLEGPMAPRAVALLFAGGNGGVVIADNAPASFKGNFLVRSRAQFHAAGIATALVGAASDRGSPEWLTDAFRASEAHAQDIAAAVDSLRSRFGRPVWLVGTSRGTLSAAAVGLQLGARVAGVVLTSGMTSVKELAIDRFAVPVLVVHHVRDTCRATDYRDLRQVTSKLAAPRTETITFSGGESRGPACEAFAYHGFNGIEAEVIATMARWMTVE